MLLENNLLILWWDPWFQVGSAHLKPAFIQCDLGPISDSHWESVLSLPILLRDKKRYYPETLTLKALCLKINHPKSSSFFRRGSQ